MLRFRELFDILLECVVVLNVGVNFTQSHSAWLELCILLVERQIVLTGFVVSVFIGNQLSFDINGGGYVVAAFVEPIVEHAGVVVNVV